MFTTYKVLSLAILVVVLLTMALMPIFSSMATVESTKAAQEQLSLNVPQFTDDGTTSHY